jgi:hypothetical protein
VGHAYNALMDAWRETLVEENTLLSICD